MFDPHCQAVNARVVCVCVCVCVCMYVCVYAQIYDAWTCCCSAALVNIIPDSKAISCVVN